MYVLNLLLIYVKQVMYDKSGSGTQFRKYTSLSLAWWHSYKWTAKQLFKVFSSDFFAPYYHHLFPTQSCHIDKLSLSAVSTYMTYMRLAYPMLKSVLMNALKEVNLSHRQKTILQNLQDIFECYIPVVYIRIYDIVMTIYIIVGYVCCLCNWYVRNRHFEGSILFL